MGTCCGKPRRISDNSQHSYKPQQIFEENLNPIEYIMGLVVDRDIALYQYTLFCVTRLVDEYKSSIYPEVNMGLVSFREDSQHYYPLCRDVYADLSWPEREIPNGTICLEADKKAKQALTDLALHYMKLACRRSRSLRSSCDDTLILSRESSMADEQCITSKDFEQFYEDTLKVIISDLQRKEIWQMSTLFNNKEFQAYLREKEPRTYWEMCEDSVLVEVPLHPNGLSRRFRMCDMAEILSDDEYSGPALASPVVNYYLPS